MDKNIIKLAVIEQRKIFEKKTRIISRNVSPGFIKTGKISLSDLGWWPLILVLLFLSGGGGLGYYIYRKKIDILRPRAC
jgi:hypothetical protein